MSQTLRSPRLSRDLGLTGHFHVHSANGTYCHQKCIDGRARAQTLEEGAQYLAGSTAALFQSCLLQADRQAEVHIS